jgi:hypothetical protein
LIEMLIFLLHFFSFSSYSSHSPSLSLLHLIILSSSVCLAASTCSSVLTMQLMAGSIPAVVKASNRN